MKHRAGLFSTAILVSIAASQVFAVSPIVVESKCSAGANYVEGGTGWGNTNSKSNKTPCGNGARSSKNAGAYADFIPTIVTEGRYDIFMTWGSTTSSNNGPNADNVQVSIVDRDGTVNSFVNMRGHSSCTINSDELIYVGNGYFKPNQGHKIRVANSATGQCYNGSNKRFVSADAVILEFQAPVPVELKSWGSIKAMYR